MKSCDSCLVDGMNIGIMIFFDRLFLLYLGGQFRPNLRFYGENVFEFFLIALKFPDNSLISKGQFLPILGSISGLDIPDTFPVLSRIAKS